MKMNLKTSMKNNSVLFNILLLVFLSLVFTSCGPKPKKQDSQIIPISNKGTCQVLVLNEGLYNMNNSSLSLLDLAQGKTTNSYFKTVNKRGLGDTGNDFALYGAKAYALISNSSLIEVINPHTGISIKQIPLFNPDQSPKEPRHICFWQDKAYICCFDGTVVRLDTNSLLVDGSCQLSGRNPDGICATQNKLYISNSGGLDYPDYDSTVSVVDIPSFTETKKITVRINPFSIAADNYGNVYVCSRGNYNENLSGPNTGLAYCLQRIDAINDVLAFTYNDIEALSISIKGDTAYLYNYDYNKKQMWIKLFDLRSQTIVNPEFISDGTSIHTPYGLAVDPSNGDVYVGDANNFTSLGKVYCFNPDGSLKFTSSVGLNPNHFVFVER